MNLTVATVNVLYVAKMIWEVLHCMQVYCPNAAYVTFFQRYVTMVVNGVLLGVMTPQVGFRLSNSV